MNALTKEEAARQLEYRSEGSRELFVAMKEAGLVAVFGASDDLVEFRGAIYDEVAAYEGTRVYVTANGLVENRCANECCPYHRDEKAKAATIRVIWNDPGPMSWTYETAIPHVTFLIKEGDEDYCRGIVFALADVVGSLP